MLDAAQADVAAEATYVFNTARYAALQAGRFARPNLRVTHRSGVFQAAEVAPGHFVSPGRASFGGFDVVDEMDFESLVDQSELALRKAGAVLWDIVLPPLCYGGRRSARELAILCQRGYILTRQELNQSLPVDNRPFLELGNYANRKRLHRSARLGVSAHLLTSPDYRAAYDAVAENRRKKGRTLSMSWTDVDQLATAFPDRIRMFGAAADGELVGAAICLAVSDDVLYVYAWGERAGAEAASPVTALAQAIHCFARAGGFHTLDLGTSSVDGMVNPGLAAFKRSLGASPSLKLWLRKTDAPRGLAQAPATPVLPVDYSAIYDPEADFDHWYTVLTSRRIVPQLRPGERILEIGSATGLLTQALAGAGRHIVCIERSPEYVARARARNLPGVEIRAETVESSVIGGQFDHVLAINVLHEVADPATLLPTLRHGLTPDGLLHVTVPNTCSLHRLSALGAGMIDSLQATSARGRRFGTLRLDSASAVASSCAAIGLRELRREAVLIKPLPNAEMSLLSDELIEAYDALAADLPQHGAMTYQVFAGA